MLYRLLERSYLRPIWQDPESGTHGLDRMLEAGAIIGTGVWRDEETGAMVRPAMSYDGPPGPHLAALDDEAQARDADYYGNHPERFGSRLDVMQNLSMQQPREADPAAEVAAAVTAGVRAAMMEMMTAAPRHDPQKSKH